MEGVSIMEFSTARVRIGGGELGVGVQDHETRGRCSGSWT